MAVDSERILRMPAFKFFNIGRANEEITRLETELATERDNNKTIVVEAEKASADLAAAQSKVTELESKLSLTASELTAAKTSADELTKERDALKATIDKPDGEIEKRASMKALELAQKQGTAAILLKPETTTSSDDELARIKGLTGLAKVIALEQHQSKNKK
jgi:chromosome segregation ATPase